MPKKKSNEIRVATLTIHHASDMTEGSRMELANWLRAQADRLEDKSEHYGHGCCIYCHEGTPKNRNDGFCSKICKDNFYPNPNP